MALFHVVVLAKSTLLHLALFSFSSLKKLLIVPGILSLFSYHLRQVYQLAEDDIERCRENTEDYGLV